MLKRTVVLVGLLSLCLIASVSSFSKAHVVSKTKIQIVRPENALIATKNISVAADGDPESGTYKVKVTNHLATYISISSIGCTNRVLNEFVQVQFDKKTLLPGEWQKISIILCDDFPEDLYGKPLEFQLKADWEEDEAEIHFEVPIEKRPAPVPVIIASIETQALMGAQEPLVLSSAPAEQLAPSSAETEK